MAQTNANERRDGEQWLGNRTAFATVLLILTGLFLLWPADAPFIGDEPMLFLLADAANQNHQLASCGLMGSVGLAYGPGPTWIYQLILVLTNAPAGWIVLHAIIMVAGMLAGLIMMSRALRFSPWFIPLVMLSPYVWFFSRHLWDNSFLLPCTALAFGSYLLYLSRRQGWALMTAVVFTVFLPLIHFMALPLTTAIVFHMLVFSRRDLWRWRWALIFITGVIVVAHAGYIGLLMSGTMRYAAHKKQLPMEWGAWTFPLFGGQLVGGWPTDYLFHGSWLPDNVAFRAAQAMSCFSYVAVICGIFLAGKCVRQAWRHRRNTVPEVTPADLSSHAGLIAVMALVLQMVVCGLSRSQSFAQYFNGLWAVYVFFAWMLVDQLLKYRPGLLFIASYGGALFAILLTMIVLVHQRGGSEGLYGPTIGNIHQIARAIGTRPRTDVYLHSFPRKLSLEVLQRICVHDDNNRMEGPLLVRSASNDPLDCHYRVQRLPPDTDAPRGLAEKQTP